MEEQETTEVEVRPKSKRWVPKLLPIDVSIVLLGVIIIAIRQFLIHSTDISYSQHSSPTFIIQSGSIKWGNRYLFDDFREAYYWLKQNTERDSKVLSWWDYGYQLTGMSNRTVIVDNNTWNNTHIGTVGKALVSNEDEGHRICKELGAKYVLVTFGGFAHYGGDDLSKFLWFVRIANSAYGNIVEKDYYNTGGGNFGPGPDISEAFKNSLAYKMMYYRFGEVRTLSGKPLGFDRARSVEIGFKDIHFTKFREVYTSRNWMIRIFEVLEEPNRGEGYKMDKKYDRRILKQPDPEHDAESGLEHSGGVEYGESWRPLL